RKNLLCTVFWLLGITAYVAYVRHPGWKRYTLVAAAFALGLMAKPMVITLPCVLLLLDFWPLRRLECASGRGLVFLRRLRAVAGEKLPLLALAAISSVLTMKAQREGGTVASWILLPFLARLKNAAVAYVAYLGKIFWPAKLAVMYPHPGPGVSWWRAIAASALL